MAAVLDVRSSWRDRVSIVTAGIRLGAGVLAYVVTGKTPAFAYLSMIRLFTLTSGRSNDLLAWLIGRIRRPYPIGHLGGVLGIERRADLERVVAQIKERGYYVFDQQLPQDTCDRLTRFALNQPCRPRAADNAASAPAKPPAVYPRTTPEAVIYDFAPHDLINDPTVQNLMADTSINALAEAYLGAKPVLDTVNLWWTTAFSQQPDRNAAQLYHFDMDHVRWLKFFVYLTDVTADTGPHCFVAGSHRSGGIPQNFLSKGYARLTDAEVSANFSPKALIEFVCGRGTIIAEDTRGLHKGKPVLKGDRLMFEFEFSNSLFGAMLPGRGELAILHQAAFATFVGRHRRIFKRWIGASTPR